MGPFQVPGARHCRTRIKTGYEHSGFLDVDAVMAIKKWLTRRREMTGSDMRPGDPMFIRNTRKPITDVWVSRLVRRLATKAGIQERLADYDGDRPVQEEQPRAAGPAESRPS